MKKLFTSFFALMFTMLTYAQIPSSMMYQVMVTTGFTTPQDVKITMELRTSQKGSAVWSKDYNFTSVADKTVENLELDFSSVDLSTGNYWLATKINNEEQGCAKLTSVPYAMVAKEVEGSINYYNIVGTWTGTSKGNPITVDFKAKTGVEDPSVTIEISSNTSTGTYKVLANGIICFSIDSSTYCDEVALIDDTHIMGMTDSGQLGKQTYLTKEKE